MHPDGLVSNWLSPHPGADGSVVLWLDEPKKRLTVSGARALLTDEVMRVARGFAWTRGRCRPVRDGRKSVMPLDVRTSASRSASRVGAGSATASDNAKTALPSAPGDFRCRIAC
jgi:hypothetical protein